MLDLHVIGERIALQRQIRDMNQEQVAEAAGISLSFYGNVERGSRCPSLETFVQIANALSCDANTLLGNNLMVLDRRKNNNGGNTRMFFCQDQPNIDYSTSEAEDKEEASDAPQE